MDAPTPTMRLWSLAKDLWAVPCERRPKLDRFEAKAPVEAPDGIVFDLEISLEAMLSNNTYANRLVTANYFLLHPEIGTHFTLTVKEVGNMALRYAPYFEYCANLFEQAHFERVRP